MAKPARLCPSRRSVGGFTLVELLVVIAVIALLIGVLVPALGKARVAGQSAVGMSNVRQLALAQSSYASRSDDWYAGPNTSGASGLLAQGKNYEFATSSSMPTTTHDWISPCLGDELGFSPNRAQRTYELFNKFRCPRANEQSVLFNDGATPGDMAEFQKIYNARGGYGQVSYLAPAPFLYAGLRSSNEAGWAPRLLLATLAEKAYTDKTRGVRKTFSSPFTVQAGYKPQASAVKNASQKVAVADGTRYVQLASGFGGTTKLDFDVASSPSLYGSFSSGTPAFDAASGSVAYSRTYGASIREFNVDLSMRFPGRQMHVGFFDGHAERINSTRAYSEPQLWYPSGSTYSGSSATPEIKAKFVVNERVP